MTLSAGRHIAFPFRIGADGRSAAPAGDSDHVRDEILQLLLTNPGERLFLPAFGGGVRRLVFEPSSDLLRGVSKSRITEALARYLGHRAAIEALEVEFAGETISVMLKFRPAGSPDSRVLRFEKKGR